MTLLFDTNVVLDLLLDREPFAGDAANLFSRVERGELNGYLCATTITTIHYLMMRAADNSKAKVAIERLLSIFDVAPVTRVALQEALYDGFDDYEDAVLFEASKRVAAQAIVTRNTQDFSASTLPVYTPPELLALLADLESD